MGQKAQVPCKAVRLWACGSFSSSRTSLCGSCVLPVPPHCHTELELPAPASSSLSRIPCCIFLSQRSLDNRRVCFSVAVRVPLETEVCSLGKASEDKGQEQRHHKEVVSYNHLVVNHGCGSSEKYGSPSRPFWFNWEWADRTRLQWKDTIGIFLWANERKERQRNRLSKIK